MGGQVVPLRHGFVGVVNRSQQDIDTKLPIQDALRAEMRWFQQHSVYRSISSRLGTPYLAKKLNMILIQHLRTSLPELKAKIEHTIRETKLEFDLYGQPLTPHSKP